MHILSAVCFAYYHSVFHLLRQLVAPEPCLRGKRGDPLLEMTCRRRKVARTGGTALRKGFLKCLCLEDHLTSMLKSLCLSQICRSAFKEYAHNWENYHGKAFFSIIPLTPSVLCRLYCCCAFDMHLLIICSVFRKHETSQIREEETFSSKRCLEWFYEYAGEVSYF